MNVALAMLWKDLVTEWRSRDRVVAMTVFALLIVVIFQFAWPTREPDEVARLAPGILWVTYVFAAVIGLGRTFATELENEALTALALAPGTRGWIFLGKAGASWVLIALVQAVTAGVFSLFFRVDLAVDPIGTGVIVLLADVAIASIGTLLSAMSVRSRFREVLLPVLLLPTLIPVLAAATAATATSLAGEGLGIEGVQPLVVIGGVYGILCFLLFDFVLDE